MGEIKKMKGKIIRIILFLLGIVCLFLSSFPMFEGVGFLIYLFISLVLFSTYPTFLVKDTYLLMLFLFYQLLVNIYLREYKTKPVNYGNLCIGIYESTSNSNKGLGTMYYLAYDTLLVSVRGSSTYYKKKTRHILYVTNRNADLINQNPTEADLEKYKYPVKTINKNYELGNDSYEYAKYERDITYKNYGFNLVHIGVPIDRNKISVSKIDGTKFTMFKSNNLNDTFLVYTNINPEFNTGWHICPKRLCTSINFNKVLKGGYGYLFRDKIYSKEETEKYWNLIEQYKLRLNTNEN